MVKNDLTFQWKYTFQGVFLGMLSVKECVCWVYNIPILENYNKGYSEPF
jgi:hypothetical protein